MGLIAKYPIALAPGMGLNAFFAFTVVLTMGIPWKVGLTGVLFSGIFFAILTVTGLREIIINAIPYQMKWLFQQVSDYSLPLLDFKVLESSLK